jgi:hypothetical protein
MEGLVCVSRCRRLRAETLQSPDRLSGASAHARLQVVNPLYLLAQVLARVEAQKSLL